MPRQFGAGDMVVVMDHTILQTGYGFPPSCTRKVFVIGIGAGNPEYVTVQAMDKPLWNAYYALGICHCTPPGRTVS